MPVCGTWFGPWLIFPIVGLALMVAFLFLVFGPRGLFAHFAGRTGWGERSERGASGGESALDILKSRYARGEITQEQFEQMRRNVA
jgi:putative membrane protein